MAILHEIFRNYVLFTHVKAFCQMHYYYSGKRNYYAIMWHAMAFKLSFQHQSPGSPHLSQPYGGTFYCNSEMRWLELHPHRRKELHSWSLHLPPPMGQGISRALFLLLSFLLPCFISVSFSISPVAPVLWLFISFPFHPTVFQPKIQNTNPSGLLCFSFTAPFVKATCG